MQSRVADSLSTATLEANRNLDIQRQVADSLRTVAEGLLAESVQARMETLVIALADAARRQTRLGDPALGALLARQAFSFGQRTDNAHEDPVYDALVGALNELVQDGSQALGGPFIAPSPGGAVRSADLSADGSMLIIGTEDAQIEAYLVSERNLELWDSFQSSGSVRDVRVFDNGSAIIIGTDDGSVQMARMDEEGSYRLSRLARMDDAVWALEISRNESYIVAGTASGQAMLISLADGSIAEELRLESRIRDIAIRGEDLAAFALENGSVVLWTFGQGETARFDADQGRVHAVAFDPTADIIVTGGDSTSVKHWGLDGSALSLRYRGHEGPINDLAFSPDGTRLASGSSDHSIQIWKRDQPGSDPIILQDHTSWVHSVTFSQDGAHVLSASNDRSAHLYNIDTEELAGRVCSTVGDRQLTSEEWDRFVGADFDMAEYGSTCSNLATARN